MNTGRGTGTLHLDLVNGTGIANVGGTPLAGTPVTGETYQIDKGGTVIGTGEGQPVTGFGSGGYALFSDVQRERRRDAFACSSDGRILAAGGIGCAAHVIRTPRSPAYCTLQLAAILVERRAGSVVRDQRPRRDGSHEHHSGAELHPSTATARSL